MLDQVPIISHLSSSQPIRVLGTCTNLLTISDAESHVRPESGLARVPRFEAQIAILFQLVL